MDCLEFNIHQLILSDLAGDVDCATNSGNDASSTLGLFTSEVLTRSTKEIEGATRAERVFMPDSRVYCNIGFAEISVHLSETLADSAIPILGDILRDVPFIEYDQCLSWDDWALSDQLVFATVKAFLMLATQYPKHREVAIGSVISFAQEIVSCLRLGSSYNALIQFAPSFHGFYRAIISTTFPWHSGEWAKISQSLNALLSPDVVDRLNRLLVDVLQAEESDPERIQFIHTFLSRYVARNRPLTGYFIVCCIMEAQWTVLSQSMTVSSTADNKRIVRVTEAAAANQAWIDLMRQPALDIELADDVRDQLNATVISVLQCFTDLLIQIEEMEAEPSPDSYAWETLSESLKLAAVCSVAQRQLDSSLFNHLKLLLSDESPVFDSLVQEAALKAATILVRNFPNVAAGMIVHLRRFVTSPLLIFEFDFASETHAPRPLSAAAKCLALCVQLAPGDDLIMSNMYSLLNYVAATSKEINESSSASQIISISNYMKTDYATLHSIQNGLCGFTEDEKRLIGISAISVVARLALEFKMEEVTRLTISMLLQRLRSAEPTVEAAIAYNLVDMALAAPESVFIDVTRAFSAINRSANPDDPRFSNNMVLAAQTRLAQGLHRRPELHEDYLVELLSLFADKGVAIQNIAISNRDLKTDDMIEQLASLLLPIDALLSHTDPKLRTDASPGLIALFRNMWFLCVLFQFTSGNDKEHPAMDWLKPALTRIAMKTPILILEDAHDSLTSDIEYNSVIRQEYAETIISKHRTLLTNYIALRTGEIRHLSPGQVIFLLAMHDMESMRSAAGLPSSLVSYFTNSGINGHPGLNVCMESIAEKVIRGCVNDLNTRVIEQSLPDKLSDELQNLLKCSTHRVAKAREVAAKYLNRLITSFPSLMCDSAFVYAILEMLTLVQRSCENEYTDEFNPTYEFHSDRSNITLYITDNYQVRKEILAQLQRNANSWLQLALGRAPVELQSTLQKYLAINQSLSPDDSLELGATVATNFGKAIGPAERQLASLGSLAPGEHDRAKILTSQIAAKLYFAGQAAGIRLVNRMVGDDDLEKRPAPTELKQEKQVLKDHLEKNLRDIREKRSNLTVQDLRRLLFRCSAAMLSPPKPDYDLLHYLIILPFEVFSPSAVSTGVEVWTWAIAECPSIEMALLTELNSAWVTTIRQGKGFFSKSVNYDDPFYHSIEYSPTDREGIDRARKSARRLLSPHLLLMHMLFSRLQAARYRKPDLMLLIQRLVLTSAKAHKSFSAHPFAREARFSFLLFAFETMKSCRLDAECENALREDLYSAAFSWFGVRPRWSYGADRVQLDAEIKLLSEFLSYLQTDSVRASYHTSSLAPSYLGSRSSQYGTRLKNLNEALRLLVENELFRLTVWANPCNEAKRGVDHVGSLERSLSDVSWANIVRTTWQLDPAIAVYLSERFRHPALHNEIGKLVRSNTPEVLDVPEALQWLVSGKLDAGIRRDLKHLLLWAPVPPVLAITFFGEQYHSDALILQYAHRVLEQHPVELTFFFVPQIVQALRHDGLGYVARFIFETAKISQLFCHQIIWNMKANCYKDDAAEVEDPLKPVLDSVTDRVVDSLSGEAKDFYDKEFGFFDEVTSISGKLRPFIKRTKPEKKAKIDEEMAKIHVEVGVYLPSNPDGKVVDIDRKSGRPLQSHAKAPFMATFKVRKERVEIESDPNSLLDAEGTGHEKRTEYDVWLQAIFKVGDDCRQDVLALQVIAMFKTIFTSVGLTLYLYPYRVTATAPGRGVIDVVPNATSRDEMGRAKVNDLLDFFISKYGGEDTIAFQQARLNFIQSMAAYSVACYILQIKDRHNGNIMIDGEGHIVHIDFGFLFDIGPGGIKFEPNSFKLTHEMVALMGGRYSQGYELFQLLTVKAFLALRPYTDQLVSAVQLMLETGLPSFKGEMTIKRLKDRFAPGLNERQAAEFMMGIIKNAHENMRSTAYDEFQRLQNGIPYK
ncbi:atypical/PIKK/PI4K protein kinase [Neolentinus lepideus HHB14362 ss-1]|uniref:1-phosphatidylinositol 4-kinase n=1 Tax=Neolentinus lepideus HHB14362 ss-1 TaxID=1314782 RepID=A0A165TXF9_9AGAM|nr:atypical/PIKK/PI4K protein kinase [Neolentinus lepideus HHB14362 ss-1]